MLLNPLYDNALVGFKSNLFHIPTGNGRAYIVL